MLATVALLNLATNALWMSYPAVANVAAVYFNKDINAIDLLGTVSLYVGIPCCLLATFVYDYVGFRGGLIFGTCVNCVGGLLRCLSTFPHLNNEMSLVSTVPSIGIVTTDLNVQKQVSPVLAHTMVVEPPESL